MTKPKPKKTVEPAEPVKVKATTRIVHGDVKIAAGAVMPSDAWIVARFPSFFEPVEPEPEGQG